MAAGGGEAATPVSEGLLLDALRQEAARRDLSSEPSRVLLIGMQAAATVSAANEIVGAERLALLHLDRATGAVGCGLGNRELLLGDDLAPLAPVTVVGLNVEAAKSYRLLRDLVAQTAGYIDPGGVVLAAGPKKGGAEVAAKVMRERFESVELLTYRKGERIFRATRPRPPEALPAGAPHVAAPSDDPGMAALGAILDPEHVGRAADATARPGAPPASARGTIETAVLQGRTLRLEQDDRIFARGRLDPASAMLAEVFEVKRGASVLDLGCGGGVLGILAAILQPTCRVTLVDSDPIAVEVSRRNAVLNGAANVTVHLSDVLADLPDQRFDLVIMNPPFHRGRTHDSSLAERFIAEAGRALQPGGSMYVVCNRFLRYERTLERLVGSVNEVTGDVRFKVLQARRGYPHGRRAEQTER